MAEFLLQIIWTVPLYGFLGSVFTLPWSLGIIRRTGPRPAAYINIVMTLLAFIHGSIVFNLVWTRQTEQLVFHWLQVADLDLTLAMELSS